MTLIGPNRLPLFPLSAVLFPDGEMRLRIFERRYLDMVRDCARDDCGFGVCLILKGVEIGEPAIPAAIGTQARIVDFYTMPDGLLGIGIRGDRRFHVERTSVRDSGLIVGDVRWFDEEIAKSVPPEHGLLVTLLESLLTQFGGLPDDARRFDDAAWVGWRLSEILPLEANDRQFLLQLSDPLDRLDRLAEWLPRLQGED